MGVYHKLPDFPRSDDLFFEITNQTSLYGKEFGYVEIKPLLTWQLTKTRFNELINILVDEDYIIKVRKDVYKILE